MKKIIITGAQGFLGSSLYQYLYKKEYHKKYDFVLIDRKDNPYEDKFSKNTLIKKIDINEGLPDLIDVEIVIHLAAIPSVRESDRRFKDVMNDNILASYNIIKKCIEKWEPKKLLIASSSSVYDGRENKPMNEESPTRLLSPYGQTKLAVEEMVQMYKNNGLLKNIDVALMRIFTVYGPRQRDELAIQAIIDSYLQNKIFTLYGDGSQRRDFCYIDDTCSGIEHLMNSTLNKDDIIYNIGTGKNHSINEIISLIGKLLNKTITIKYEEPTIYDTMYTLSDSTRLRYVGKEDWIPKTKFVDGIKEEIEWQKKQLILKN
jgi:nucleoside-diphosphate-sugar epimerase